MSTSSSTVVVKIGTSSLTDDEGVIDASMVARLCEQLVGLRAEGRKVVLVTSAAIAAGLPELGLGGTKRPSDPITLQAVASGASLPLSLSNPLFGTIQ